MAVFLMQKPQQSDLFVSLLNPLAQLVLELEVATTELGILFDKAASISSKSSKWVSRL